MRGKSKVHWQAARRANATTKVESVSENTHNAISYRSTYALFPE